VRALVLSKDAVNMVDDQPAPVLLPGEALVRMRAAGVCDTDLQLARGYMGFAGIPGHEMVGVVSECATDEAWVGKRVVADINAGCGTCNECKLHGSHHCPNRTVLGILKRGGAFAEILAVPVSCLVEVPESVSDDAAVFAEPLAAALHVLDDLPRAPNRAIVLGDGKLGLLIARALVSAGVATHVIGRHARKLALAAGATTSLEKEASESGAELVIEATGSEAGLERALSLVAPRGTIVLKTTVAAKLNVDLAPVVIHEIRIIGSRCGDMKKAISHLASGKLDPTPLIEARYPLAKADEALAHAGRRGTLKVLIDAGN
jgi:2-desacetyl-2-hydroxyethyl bacteriochlorophyllide A dehydrogenase